MSLVTFVAFNKDENAENYVVDWKESKVCHFRNENNIRIAKSLQYLGPSESQNFAQDLKVLTNNYGQRKHVSGSTKEAVREGMRTSRSKALISSI